MPVDRRLLVSFQRESRASVGCGPRAIAQIGSQPRPSQLHPKVPELPNRLVCVEESLDLLVLVALVGRCNEVGEFERGMPGHAADPLIRAQRIAVLPLRLVVGGILLVGIAKELVSPCDRQRVPGSRSPIAARVPARPLAPSRPSAE